LVGSPQAKGLDDPALRLKSFWMAVLKVTVDMSGAREIVRNVGTPTFKVMVSGLFTTPTDASECKVMVEVELFRQGTAI
jgi:hypothetical protein